MRFRERLVLAASLTSLIGLGAGFSFVYERVCAEHVHEIDRVLGIESREEADEVARSELVHELPDDPELKATNIGPLRKYAVLYDSDGRVLARSALVGARAPELAETRDIMEFTLDGKVVGTQPGKPYSERFIHGVLERFRSRFDRADFSA